MGFAWMVVLLLSQALLGAATKYNNLDAGRMPTCILALRGGGGWLLGGRDWGVLLCRLIVKLRSCSCLSIPNISTGKINCFYRYIILY
jgi:hypothetical protein